MEKDSEPFQVVFNDIAQQKLGTDVFQNAFLKLLDYLQLSDVEIGLSIVSPAEIHRLNKKYRDIDRTTDILSFALLEGESVKLSPATWPVLRDAALERGENPVLLGDLVLSEAECGADPEGNLRHIMTLIIHGVLHLLGYDHEDDEHHGIMELRAAECFSHLFPGGHGHGSN